AAGGPRVSVARGGGRAGRAGVGSVGEPVFDYGRVPAEWSLVDGSRHIADASGADVTVRLVSDLQLGIEGNRVRAHHVLATGEKCYCTLTWAEGLRAPEDYAEAEDRKSTRLNSSH